MFFVQSFFCSPCFSRFWSIKFNYQIQKLKRNYLNVIFWKVLIKQKLSLLLLASSKMKSWVTVYPIFRIFVYFSRLSSFNRYIYAGDISVYSHYRGRKLSKARKRFFSDAVNQTMGNELLKTHQSLIVWQSVIKLLKS